MKKLLLFIIILVGLSLALKLNAQTAAAVYLNFDLATISRGYTAQSLDENFKVGFGTNSFSRAVNLKIDNLRNEIFTIPDNLKLVSDVYLYDFGQKPNKPLDLSIKHSSFSALPKKIYFWDGNKNQWRALTSLYIGNKNINVKSPFKFAKVAVLEEKITNDNQLINFITAKSAIVMDAKTGEVLFAKDAYTPRPIASLTKLMTAMIFLKYNPGWDQEVEFIKEDDTMPAKINLDEGDAVKVSDLFYAMLVKSANNAAKALTRITGLHPGYFNWLMNLRAQELGLGKTIFFEPTGLEATNVSTAYEYAILSKYALKIPDIPRATTAATYSFKTLKYNKQIDLENSTKLFGSDLNITMTKTGYTYEAGNCLMTAAKNLQTGKELIAVALDSKPGFLSADVYTLIDYFLNK